MKIPYEKPIMESWNLQLETSILAFSNEKPGEDNEPLNAPSNSSII